MTDDARAPQEGAPAAPETGPRRPTPYELADTRSGKRLGYGFAGLVVGIVLVVIGLAMPAENEYGEESAWLGFLIGGGFVGVLGAASFGMGMYYLGTRVDALYERMVAGDDGERS
ncbi:hypothetical protein GCM10009809_23730 [Isoptericola hypogeus]|uniref:Uncharacterized protein n=1 Tax=Isoptericola hypogeus TaxID=300179 RepID=A0ABN2JHC7_9MICO